MLRIRKEQNKELAKVALKRFEDSMVEHVKKFFTKFYEISGESIVRSTIQLAVTRAEAYGFISERDVCYYINLMFLLGSNFDNDPQLPWVGAILNDKAINHPGTKAKKLYDETLAYLDKVAGPNDEHFKRALLKVSDIQLDNLSHSPAPNIEKTVSAHFQRVWPEKYKNMGQAILRRLILHGSKSANSYNITGERGVVTYAVLMFMLGSGFDSDPLCPWASAILNDDSIKDQNTRVERLYSEFMVFVNKWLV